MTRIVPGGVAHYTRPVEEQSELSGLSVKLQFPG